MLKALSVLSDDFIAKRIQRLELKLILTENIDNLEKTIQEVTSQEIDFVIIDKDIYFYDEATKFFREHGIEFLIFETVGQIQEAIILKQHKHDEKIQKELEEKILSEPKVEVEHEIKQKPKIKLEDNKYISLPTQAINISSLYKGCGSTSIALLLGKYFSEHLKLKTLIIETSCSKPYLYDYFNVYKILMNSKKKWINFEESFNKDAVIGIDGIDYIVREPSCKQEEFDYNSLVTILDLFKDYPVIIFNFDDVSNIDKQLLNRFDKNIIVLDPFINKIITNLNKINDLITNNIEPIYVINKSNDGIKSDILSSVLRDIYKEAIHIPLIDLKYFVMAAYESKNPYLIPQIKDDLYSTIAKISTYILPFEVTNLKKEIKAKKSILNIFKKGRK